MHGNLEEIDINSYLNFIGQQHYSGIFFIEDEPSNSSSKDIYFLFFNRGEIVFAGDKYSFNFKRINDYLQHYNLIEQFNGLQKSLNKTISITEYEAILLLANKQLIDSLQQKDICQRIIEEILFKIISLDKGRFVWQNSFNLQPLIINLQVGDIVPIVTEQIVTWYRLSPYIQDIEQCPLIISPQHKEDLSKSNDRELFSQVDGKTSFIQLSRCLNEGVSNIAQKILPYVKKGIIRNINPTQQDKITNNLVLPLNNQVVAFSLHHEWTLNIDKIISLNKYNLLIPENINQFLTYVLNLPIKLIILQSEIENIENAYNLCNIVRQNSQTSHLPIILVIDEYMFQDNLVSKMYGVTEYISYDLFHKKMLPIINKYL